MRNYYEKDWQLYLQCSKCWEYKLPTEFSKMSKNKFWVRTVCRICDSEYGKLWRANNHDKHLNASREYHEKHREHDREYNRKYRQLHKEARNKSEAKYPERKKARRTTYNYIKYNNISIPDKCWICWAEWKIEMHHPDYNKWNVVVPCCKQCHALIHRWDIKEYLTINILNYV